MQTIEMPTVTLRLIGLALGLLCGCARQAPDNDLLATVGAREIRTADLIREAERQHRMGRRDLDGRALLDELITREALLCRAVRSGLDQDPSVRRNYENLLIAKLKESHLQPRFEEIEINPDEIAAFQNRERSEPGIIQSRLAALYLRTTPRTSELKSEQLRALMNQARERALKLSSDTPGFGELAIDYSEDQRTRYSGGEIGWFDHDPDKYNLPREVLDAGFALKATGDVSDVVRTTNGFYLVKLMDRSRSGPVRGLDSEASVRHTMLLQKRKQIETDFLNNARSEASVTMYPQNLDRVTVPDNGMGAKHSLFSSVNSPEKN